MIEGFSPKDDFTLGLYAFLLLTTAAGVNTFPDCFFAFYFSY